MVERKAQEPKSTNGIHLTGKTVGRFAIRSLLRKGSAVEVYLAEDSKLKLPVVVKRIAPSHPALENYRHRLLREAELAARLNHPHIAAVYDILEENGEIFLVTEYVQGEALRRRLGESFAIEEFLDIAVQCGEALVAAHGQGIVHRNLKPENIMLTSTGQVKIIDFGLANRLPPPTTASGAFVGTPAYMAPEVLLQKEIDSRADIFSLGIVFYEMLTGRHPFLATSWMATQDRILHEAPPLTSKVNPHVPLKLARIVAKMLAKEAVERYRTTEELLMELRVLQRGVASLDMRPIPRFLKISCGLAGILSAIFGVFFVASMLNDRLGDPFVWLTVGIGTFGVFATSVLRIVDLRANVS